MRIFNNLILAAVSLLLSVSLTCCDHVEANIPEQSNFKPFLIRDLNSYFTSALKKRVQVEYDLLRDNPTQVGVAYPKFYVWVRIFSGKEMVEQGAVRVAACDNVVFQVTDFVSKEQIKKDPEITQAIFPAVLCPAIIDRAQQK